MLDNDAYPIANVVIRLLHKCKVFLTERTRSGGGEIQPLSILLL